MNAAVEAARAGSHGRVFSVVASEVRNLATRCGSAAREASDLITKNTEEVRIAHEISNEVVKGSAEARKAATGARDATEAIVSDAQAQVTQAQSLQDQVSAIDNETQKNAALAEQTAASSTELQHQSTELATRLAFFQISETTASIAVSSDLMEDDTEDPKEESDNLTI